jgi:hypothetical protein
MHGSGLAACLSFLDFSLAANKLMVCIDSPRRGGGDLACCVDGSDDINSVRVLNGIRLE